MLSGCQCPEYIDHVLKRVYNDGSTQKTCLTLALENELHHSALDRLFKEATLEALRTPDGLGKTPLHYAVQYDQCDDKRLTLIESILEKDSISFKTHKRTKPRNHPFATFLDYKYIGTNDVEISVFAEHQKSAQTFREKKKPEARTVHDRAETQNFVARPKGKTAGRTEVDKGSRIRSSEIRDRLTNSPKEEKADDEADIDRARQERRIAQEMARTDNKPHLEHFKDSLPAARTPKGVVPIHQSSGGVERPTTPNMSITRSMTDKIGVSSEKKNTETKGPSHDELEKNSQKLLSMLKLHYMRTRNIQDTTSFLYGKNPKDIQLCFDYGGLPNDIKDYEFNSGFHDNSSFKFDEVLMYVRFPNVSVRATGKNATESCQGRKDMEFFFKWLKAKHVKHILEVEVIDNGTLVHSDQSIQKSLGDLVVEHLNWQKTDLDPRVICEVHPGSDPGSSENMPVNLRTGLREITLLWSGSNAVLRAWSEPEGLCRLDGLQVVNLKLPDLNSVSVLFLVNIEEFRRRLNLNRDIDRQIEIHKIDFEQKAHSTSRSTPHKRTEKLNKKEHEWLKCMEEFAETMGAFWKEEACNASAGEAPQDGSEQRIDLSKPIIIGLIDDGVNFCDQVVSGHVEGGKSFDYHGQRLGQHYDSESGHGTRMAQMILRMCPMAKIYSVRLKMGASMDGHATIDPIPAALAIEAALEKNVDIISISWTIPTPTEKKERDRLDEALGRAHESKTPVFCAASDHMSCKEHYPSFYNTDAFIRIGAAHEDGSIYNMAQGQSDFIFPGVNIDTGVRDTTTPLTEGSTGSSIATAVGAGLAAMIIYCFKASALLAPHQLSDGSVKSIAESDSIKHAFRRINRLNTGESELFLEVFEKFGSVSKVLAAKDKSNRQKVKALVDLCLDLRLWVV
ncbi:hypothetical protein H9Q74_005453 [Fusarium xylarioides]|nr:hypothetical protein H9Q71_005447 [Fusarium xylarioides]KAG5824471.1 hypothetical protein H9Q74_005453 [Fusarium xylarioides]